VGYHCRDAHPEEAVTSEANGAPIVRVAVADDSDDLCLMLAELVNSSPGLQCVAQITSQSELLSSIAAAQPDVLVLDLLFGGVSSLPLVPQLHAANSRTRIVIHSGYDIDPLSNSALDGGAVAVVPKGGDPEELIATIRRVALV
jgi:two-component system, NarL family, invasion response regulator UvrY